jgi:multidrug resistance protein, MATE family
LALSERSLSADRASASDSASTVDSWWGRPGGGREVLGVAAPLVVSSLSWTIMTFVDRMMLNHWSGAAMSAAFMGGVVWWAVVCLPLGICAYTGTFVAQYHGSGHPERIGPAVWQGAWIALLTSPLVLAMIPLGSSLLGLNATENEYFGILCWSAPAMLASQSLSSFYSGRGKTVMVMIVDAAFALLNVVLDWWWIFGLTIGSGEGAIEVFPAWGIAGAAWATTVSMWFKAATYLMLFVAPWNHRAFAAWAWPFDLALVRRMLYYGIPSGVQMMLDIMGFTVFVMLVGRLGEVEKEATSMTFSVGSLAFMPVMGIGLAASILVGQHLGENRDQAAARATWTSMQVSWVYMGLVSLVMIGAPEWMLSGFFVGEAVEGDSATRAAVASTAVVLLRFVSAYNFVDAMAIVFVSALKGAGDTRFVLIVSLCMATLLGGLTWVAVEVYGAGLYGCWAVVSLWIASLGVIFLLRFLNGAWRSMRVIEESLVKNDVE